MSQKIESFNPATGESTGSSILHTTDDLKKIVITARAGQQKWAEVPVAERKKYLLKVRDFIINNSDRIADRIARDNGKTRIDALATEVMPAAMAVSYYCKNAERFLEEKKIRGGNLILMNKRSKIVHLPLGLIGIISPWNYPFAIPVSEVVMGLLAGNAVILKTASETQMVGLILKEAVESAMLPEWIFNYVNMPGKIAGDAFLECGLDKIFFTGSVSAGKYLLEKAAGTLTPVSLELGGNDAMIVCEDADPYRAAAGALWAGFQNAGQSCGGIERIYVQEKIYPEFMRILKDKIDGLRVRYDSDFGSDMGCMTTKKQKEVVENQIKDALGKGAQVFAQSEVPDTDKYKNFLPATVLINVDHDMDIMKDETFGPVVGVMKFSDYEDAVKMANDSYLGLTGSVWTKNVKRGNELAVKIKAGVVTINDHLMSHGLPETPWGGVKQSGLGRTHGEIGFMSMTQPMTIVKDIMPFVKKNLWWHPFSQNLYEGLKGVMNFLYGKKIAFRIKGLVALVKIIPRIFREE